MKSKHIKKLRLKVSRFKTFKIKETNGLFGDFWGSKEKDIEIKAESETHAIERYFKMYWRKYKQKSNNDKNMIPTTHRWGTVRVIDSRGFSCYYH